MTDISIIIPVYNAEEYLKVCLDSIITQDLDDIEIICIDDGSTDNSVEIIESYAKRDRRIISIFQENKGVSQARNSGIQIATGSYILFVDADDFLANNSLKYLFETAQNNSLDILIFGYYHLLNDIITPTAFINIWKNKFPSVPFTFKFEDSFILNGSIWNKLISRQLLNNSQASFPENISYAEDTIFCFRLYPFTHKIQVVPEIFYYYRNREDASLSCQQDVFQTLFSLFPEFIKNIPESKKISAMDYWCNFFTWNLLKKKNNLDLKDYEVIKTFLRQFDCYSFNELSGLEHFNRLKEVIKELRK